MPRQKTKHTQILSERVRKSTFKRRLDSLFKKAHELSILCGIEIVIIVNDPKEGHSTLWPSQDEVMSGVMKFLDCCKEHGTRNKKIVLHEKFLNDNLKTITEKLLKLQKKNDETEMRFLMHQLFEGGTFNELDLRQLNGLDHFVDEKLEKLESRYSELAGVQGQLSCTYNLHHFQMTPATIASTELGGGTFATTPMAALTGDMTEEGWFSMSRGINIGSPEVGRSFIEENQGGVPDEFGRVWLTSFYP